MSSETLNRDKSNYELLPRLEDLMDLNETYFTQERMVSLCQNLINSGKLNDFEHPVRRLCYLMAGDGMVENLFVPQHILKLVRDNSYMGEMNVSIH